MARLARFAMTIAAIGLAGGPAHAASTATMRLVAVIPISCEIDSNGGSIENGRVVLFVRRTCNTSHSIHISGDFSEAPSDMVIRYGGQQVAAASGDAWLQQPELYYDGFDQITVESPTADTDEFVRIAQSIQVTIDVD